MHRRRKSLVVSLILIAVVLSTGTLGYYVLEDWTIFDSLYMTVITITTIGFREVHEMSDAGRMFTVFLILMSVGAVFYALNNAAKLLIEGEFRDFFGRRKLVKQIEGLKGHYIVCGMGRMGRIICKELKAVNTSFVVIEKQLVLESPEAQAGGLPTGDYLVLEGDATKDEVLMKAGIERAVGLISVLPSDAENLYVVLSARGMNPTLKIVARAVEEGADKKLMRAGADRVVSPYHIGGIRIAHTMLKPSVVDFIEFTTHSGEVGLEIEEISVSEGSAIDGQTLASSGIGRELNIIVVAIKQPDGRLRINPGHGTVMGAGSTLVVIGESDKLERLEKMSGH